MKIYVGVDSTSTSTRLTTSLTSDQVTYNADLRYPSKYKQLKSYTLNWNTRLTLESIANPCMFVTLTYNDDYYVENRLDGRDVKEVLKDDWQRFCKRFRRQLEYNGIDISSFKYYAITERGDDGRLHFHALIFGFDYESFPSRNAKGKRILHIRFNKVTEILDKSWHQGFTFYEAACPQNIEYVNKYIHKRRISGDYISLKSNGIGLSWLDEKKKKMFIDNDQQYYNLGRRKLYLPRYLKHKIWTDVDDYRAMSERLAIRIAEEELKEIRNNTSESALCENKYVVYPESDYMLHVVETSEKSEVIKVRLDESKESFALATAKDLCEVLAMIDYDKENDQILFCYIENDPLRWFRLRRRQNENYKMKYIYFRRL